MLFRSNASVLPPPFAIALAFAPAKAKAQAKADENAKARVLTHAGNGHSSSSFSQSGGLALDGREARWSMFREQVGRQWEGFYKMEHWSPWLWKNGVRAKQSNRWRTCMGRRRWTVHSMSFLRPQASKSVEKRCIM